MPRLIQSRAQRIFGAIPALIATDAVLGAGRKLDAHIVKTEVTVDGHDQIVDLEALLGQLIGRAIDMCVILGETAHAQQSVQRP